MPHKVENGIAEGISLNDDGQGRGNGQTTNGGSNSTGAASNRTNDRGNTQGQCSLRNRGGDNTTPGIQRRVRFEPRAEVIVSTTTTRSSGSLEVRPVNEGVRETGSVRRREGGTNTSSNTGGNPNGRHVAHGRDNTSVDSRRDSREGRGGASSGNGGIGK